MIYNAACGDHGALRTLVDEVPFPLSIGGRPVCLRVQVDLELVEYLYPEHPRERRFWRPLNLWEADWLTEEIHKYVSSSRYPVELITGQAGKSLTKIGISVPKGWRQKQDLLRVDCAKPIAFHSVAVAPVKYLIGLVRLKIRWLGERAEGRFQNLPVEDEWSER